MRLVAAFVEEPRLLLLPPLAREPADNVPALIVVTPEKLFAPESAMVPAPALMRPPVPEITAETVRSAAALLESPIVNVRVEDPRLSKPEMVAPSGLLVAL